MDDAIPGQQRDIPQPCSGNDGAIRRISMRPIQREICKQDGVGYGNKLNDTALVKESGKFLDSDADFESASLDFHPEFPNGNGTRATAASKLHLPAQLCGTIREFFTIECPPEQGVGVEADH
jgi:hypothetical protein